MKILILGHKGMLGNANLKYFSQYFDCQTINYRWPSQDFRKMVQEFEGEYIINCIGSIPQRSKDFQVNLSLPIFLDKYCKCPIFHPSTDCQGDGSFYGFYKQAASDWILAYGKRTIIIKTSIIGLEIDSSFSLLNWFLNQTKVDGYIDSKWNGITSLEWAKQVHNLMLNKEIKKINIFSSQCISKYELLHIFNQVFQKNIEIEPKYGVGSNKCLIGGIQVLPIREQLLQLRAFYCV